MSQAEDNFIRVSCPQCGKRLKAPPKLAGDKIHCPKCDALVKLPPAPSKNDDHDWLSLDEDILGESPVPVNPKAKQEPKAVPAKPPAPTPSSAFDDDEFKLAPQTPAPKRTPTAPVVKADPRTSGPSKPPNKNTAIDESLPPISLDHEESIVNTTNDKEEFRFNCKVCGTLMYKPRSMIGQMTECPDCFSKFKIPAPAVVEKKKPRVVLSDDADDVQLAPTEGKGRIDGNMTAQVAQETLQKARQALDEEDQEDQAAIYDFDTAGWLKRTFSFLLDPATLVIIIVFGLLMGAVIFATFLLETWSEEAKSVATVLKVVVLLGVGGPAVFALLANGLAVLEASANSFKRVPEWPLFNMGDWIAEAVMPCTAMALAAVPAGILSYSAQSLELHPLVSVGGTLVIVWLLFPPLLLSMLDNQSITSPVSGAVFGSFRTRPDAWGAMLMMTAMGSLLLFVICGAAWSIVPSGGFIIGFSIPFYTFFVFHQLGILASRIAEVTSLHFESGPAADKEAEDKVAEEPAKDS